MGGALTFFTFTALFSFFSYKLKLCIKTPEELFRRNYDAEEKKKAPCVKGSTIRERDKKNAEYYIGDYSDLIPFYN